ncbi:hypothetical protein [Actinocorallia lasiicapitis]
MITLPATATATATAPATVPAGPECGAVSLQCVLTAGGTKQGGTKKGLHGRPRPEPAEIELIDCPDGAQVCVTTLIPVPKVATRDVVEMAVARLAFPFPRPRVAPAPVTWVNLSTALWITPDGWRTLRASASAGGQRVTMRGSPERIVWTLPDGEEVCTTPGTAKGPCFHSFVRSSRGPVPVVATVEYVLDWTCEGRCDQRGGRIGPLQAPGRTSVEVREIQTSAN